MGLPIEWAEKLEGRGKVTPARRTNLPAATASRFPWSVEFTVLCTVVSEANRRDHWAVRRRRFAEQAHSLNASWDCVFHPDWRPMIPCLVTFTRIGVRPMDSDNLAGAFKALRDAVAARIGVDDGDESAVRWEYRQEKGAPGVRVRIEARV